MVYKPRHRADVPQDSTPSLAAKAPAVDAIVVHPLYPELGTGVVETAGKAAPSDRAGRVRWSTGQVSTHNLAVLKEVEG